MPDDPDLSALTAQQQVTFWVGTVAQNDAHLEALTRRLYREIAGNGFDPVPNEPETFGRLREATKDAVKAAGLPDDVSAELLQLLADVGTSHADRVEIVHDIWAQDEATGGFGRGNMLMGKWDQPDKRAPRPVSFFHDAAKRQMRVFFRLIEAGQVVTRLQSNQADAAIGRLRDSDLARLDLSRAAVRGEFRLEDDGSMTYQDVELFRRAWDRQP